MSRLAKCLCAVVVCVASLSCGSTKMVGVWGDPDFQGTPGPKILVIGLGENEPRVKLFEAAMAGEINKKKATAIPGSSIFAVGAPIDTTGGRRYVTENKIDLISVTRVVGISKELEFTPPTTYYTPVAAYHGFYPYYYTAYAAVSTPGYLREYKVFTVETNVYSTKTEQLVWSGSSQTVDPASLNQAMGDVAFTLVNAMSRSGLFGTKK